MISSLNLIINKHVRIVIASNQPLHTRICCSKTYNNSCLGDVKRNQIYKMTAIGGCWKCDQKKAEFTDLTYQKHSRYLFHLQK